MNTAKGFLFAFLVTAAGCTDIKPMQVELENLKAQVSQLQADLAKSSSMTAANRSTATSVSAASSTANKALQISESNTAAIDALNAKIDQMFKRSPPN
jgi:predicted  nucleic acid-binding Zn-ribbon protein